LLCRPDVTKWWQKLLGITIVSVLILLVGFQWITSTHRWFSDIVGGALIGFGWFFFTIQCFASRVGARSAIAVAGAFACAFFALRLLPAWRVNVPTPMVLRGDSASPIESLRLHAD